MEDYSIQSLTPFDISLTPVKIHLKPEINDKISALKYN